MTPTAPDCLLTLAIPARLEEAVLDHLQAHPEWVDGFSVTTAEGYGSAIMLEAALEKVRGRAARRQIVLPLRQDQAHALLASLREAFRNPQMSYWMTPLVACGSFA
ncbi:Protein of unknown function [Noviherbaspirillum humi]|uniref:DUF3240 domain-containing protein n=1 Tax=Noviherbaspirillum humi TaxID=1688639 RepID=A0A239G8E5_9BURK|nr:DUF3240 family protein [Noviherbaspirillum humi]SNS64982.1 Protein of unknown function [Noviherbaspirillum humi]